MASLYPHIIYNGIMIAKKKIVILGAGFGGLRAATQIARKLEALRILPRYEVILVDRNEHHTYTPLLYEVATTSKQTANITDLHAVATHPIHSLIARFPVTFIQKEVMSLDALNGTVVFSGRERIRSDYLVVALGAETNFFDIPGVEKRALTLKTFRDAVLIRDAVSNRAMEGAKAIRIVIGGGGSTGVELAAECKAWCGELEKDFPQCRLSVTIIEGAPSILPGFDSRVVDVVRNRLRLLGIAFLEGEKVARADAKNVFLVSGRGISYDILIWAGGVKAASVLGRMPLQKESRGRIEVTGGMECLPQTATLKLHAKIYGLGDAICFYDPVTRKSIPGVARAAIAQADVASHNIIEEIKSSESPTYSAQLKTYYPRTYPYIIPVGGKYAVAKIGPFVISGFLGWVLKGLVEFNYLISIMTLRAAFRTWRKGLKIFIQNDRLG